MVDQAASRMLAHMLSPQTLSHALQHHAQLVSRGSYAAVRCWRTARAAVLAASSSLLAIMPGGKLFGAVLHTTYTDIHGHIYTVFVLLL